MADREFIPADAEQTWIRDSDVPGPTTLILGGVHGYEQAGTEVVKRMVSGDFTIPLERGRLVIALGNLAAIEKNVRQTEVNLNRMFLEQDPESADYNTYEARRARELMPLLDMSDSALDLHGFRQKDGKPFIITEPRGFGAARAIGAPFISSGWSSIEAGGTDGYMEELGRIGICYELSQLEDLKRGIPRGEQGVLNFLSYMQVIDLIIKPVHDGDPQFVHAISSELAREGFEWGPNWPYRSWQSLEPGELVARNGINPEDAIHAALGQVIIFPSDVARPKSGEEMFNIGNIIHPDDHSRPVV